ncbi:alpha-mannosidase [Lachnospiraceae bacterium TF09-5]|nr:alpha-mannosidase [Lachnospiraceae bacterium TF09-5]
MKVKDPHFILEKIEKYIQEDIRPSRVRAAVDLENWKYYETSMEEKTDTACAADFDDSAWQDFKLWDTWGGYDRVAWFRTKVEVPEELIGKTLAVRLLVGPRDGGESTAETLLYIDGKPVQGIDIWHEEAFLEETLCRKKEMQIALKAWSGVLVPPRFRTFKLAQLLWIDGRVDRFCFMADTVRRCALLLDENDLRRIRLTKLLNQTFEKITFLNFKEETYYQSIYNALDFLQAELDEMGRTEEIKPVVYGVGHSHIDMAWLWRLSATREKASRTFSTVLNLMKQYPEYRYMHSSPQLYQFLKEDYPEIYEQVKERIREGRWEITGGMWVEPDTNIPSGESLVRQFLYGKRFIREEFGKETTLCWLPDVFGYSAAFPQIMKKSGMKYFMTTKISWNQYNHFPYDTFWWKGIDGSEIFTHFITTPEDGSWFYTYNGHMDPEEVTGVWENYKDKDKNDELLIAYGWGDGGGGPTREMLEQSRVMKNIPGIPRVEMSSAEGYFRRLYDHADKENLGKWDGELYFELHRGTYTSQAETKRYNRKTEILLHNIELLAALAHLDGAAYPRETLDGIWERVLLNQFHDILPGSSIRQVYEDTARDYEAIQEKGAVLLEEAKEKLSEKILVNRNSVVLYNTAGYERSDYVCIPYGGGVERDTVLLDEDGPVSRTAGEDGILAYVEKLPSFGYKTLQIAGQEAAADAGGKWVSVCCDAVISPFYRITFNANGEIETLYDREAERQVDCGRPMNVFAAFEDKPQRFDAWDVDVYYKEKPYAPFVLTKREVVSQGETAVIRSSWKFNRSVLTQDMIVYADDRRIDFVTTVDWKEKQVFLKAYFPVDVHAGEASYEIQFGNIRRPTHTNTEWDFARFEVPGHRWADLSQGDYGVAILNDCKYGYDVHENVLGLSLLKSAVRPDETADRKVHHFTYSLYPHRGTAETADVTKAAINLNMPVLTQCVPADGQGESFVRSSFVHTDCGHILLDTVKLAEDGKSCVVRLYEYKNCSDDKAGLFFDRNLKRVAETNLCEEEEREIAVNGNGIAFAIGCYEIKTFKVYF